MKKLDFKKLMLLGISAGALLASQANAAQNDSTNGTLLAGGCGGRHGCNGYTPYPPANSCASTPNYNNGNSGNGSGNSTGKNNSGGYTAYQPTQGCGAHQPYYNTTPSYPPQQGCGSYQPAQPTHQCASSHGCGGAQPSYSSAPSAQPQNQTTYNQWSSSTGGFTAEATKPAAPATHAAALSESDLLSPKSPLNEQSKMLFRGLDQEGKTMALKLVNQSCKGQNECKGLNSCKTKDHSCAGRGSCAGTSAGPFQDKNQAVKIAAMRMAEKRAGAIPGATPGAAPAK